MCFLSLSGFNGCCVGERCAVTSVPRNENMARFKAGSLFQQMAERRNAHMEQNPEAKVISLGMGDTTEPLTPTVAKAMADAALGMGTRDGYSGYGDQTGLPELRQLLADSMYPGGQVKASEIFVSAGSQCDLERLQMMFGKGITVSAQDPSYPGYVDTAVLAGHTGPYNDASACFEGVEYMACRPDNDFFPDLANTAKIDIIFFCSPNNPTGTAASRAQLESLVAFANKNGSMVVYDAAYALYIEDDECPKSIFEIEGADEVAIEICSFSKYAGFTGVRLGWTVVPEALKYADGSPVIDDFTNIVMACFTAASIISQKGGIACLTEQGFKELKEIIAFYKENARMLRATFTRMGFTVHGGRNAPYIWVEFPGRDSWDVFAEILDKCDIVTMPEIGFGPAGHGFVRVSAFGTREDVVEAIARLQSAYGQHGSS